MLSENWETIGALTALEDTRVLILQRKDFTNLLAALPVHDEYFNRLGEKLYASPLRRYAPRNSQSNR